MKKKERKIMLDVVCFLMSSIVQDVVIQIEAEEAKRLYL